MGAYLTDYVVRPFSHHRRNSGPWSQEGLAVETVLEELFFLEIFSVDYAVTVALGHSPRRQAVMESFWTVLRRRSEGDWPSLEGYRRRYEAYQEGLSSPASEPTAALGSLFASFCGDGLGVLTEQAVTEFATAATAIVKLLMRFQVVEPR